MLGDLYLNLNNHSKYILKHNEMYDLSNYNIIKLNNDLNSYPYLESNGLKYYGHKLQDKLLENIGLNCLHLDKYYHNSICNNLKK